MMNCNVTYLGFEQFTPDNKLRDQFLSEATGMKLGAIIKSSKGLVRPVFHKAIGLESIYLVIIVGVNDGVLIRLANECGFPRGFPIIWQPKKRMQYFGFYPKFSNDERQLPDDLSEFNNVTGLEFFKKWSGFLGQLLIFEINNNKYWTVTSKNSATSESPFVQDARRLFEPFITDEVVNIMLEKRLHICAEMISKNDQVHGSRVLSESPVVTAIGSGHLYDLPLSQKEQETEFVQFYDNKMLVDFCTKYRLPCDSAVYINDGSAAKEFIKQLSIERDFMTDDNLEKMVKNFDKYTTITKGTIKHSDIIGNCLEGLVIKLYDTPCGITNSTNQNVIIKKYKFAPYTIRTLLLREVFDNFVFGYTLKNHIQKFIDGWCVSEKGAKYWRNFALECFMMYQEMLSKEYIPDNKQVGIHIEIADKIMEQQHSDNIQEIFDKQLVTLTNGTIIICVGPIGSGKTTFASELSNKNPLFVVIDGDTLDLGKDITMKLGKERNDYSRWKIIQALMSKKIPIISAGGGILFSSDKNQSSILRSQIYKTLGIVCRIILCVSGNFDNITLLNKNYDPQLSYNNNDLVKQAVVRRVNLAEWKIDRKIVTKKDTPEAALNNFADFIAKKSSDNYKFALKLIADADYIFGYPYITSNNYGIQSDFDFNQILAHIIPTTNMSYNKFSQIRILTLVNDNIIGHITMGFSTSQNLDYSSAEFEKISKFYPSIVAGQYIKVSSDNSKNTYTFAIPEYPIHDDKSTHITIDCGNHAPKETGAIVRAIMANEKIIQLPTKDNHFVKYNLQNLISEPCQIHILGVFGI